MVVNHDGGDTTLRGLHALGETDWPADALELVLVDNASSDGLVDRVRELMPSVTVVRSDVNRGFGGGSNLAMADRSGIDHIALLNPDTQVEPGWLRPLVAMLDADPKIGAACPKLLLTGRYVRLEVRSPTDARRRWSREPPSGVHIHRVEVGNRDVTAHTRFVAGVGGAEPGGRRTGASAVLYVPAEAEGRVDARIELSARLPRPVTLASGETRAEHTAAAELAWYRWTADGPRETLVNNVGTELVGDAYGANRGWLEPDHGQYDTPTDVFAWCGGAVLLRGAYLDDVGLFDERLFLYYEDVELSWRGRQRGWRYRTVPSSVVRHEHAASTVEGSELSDYFNERNRLLVVTRHGTPALATRTWVRHLLVSGSYAERDLERTIRGERGDWRTLGRRLRAFAGAGRLAPAMVSARRQDRRGEQC